MKIVPGVDIRSLSGSNLKNYAQKVRDGYKKIKSVELLYLTCAPKIAGDKQIDGTQMHRSSSNKFNVHLTQT